MKAAALAGRILFGLVLIAIGALLAIGGAQLIWLGGSFYYLPAGVAAAASGLAVLFGRWRIGAAIYLVLMTASLVWGIAEAGLSGWALAPRLLSPFVLGLPFLIAALIKGPRLDRRAGVAALAVTAIVVVAVTVTSGFQLVPAQGRGSPPLAAAEADGEWRHFGNNQAGTFFSPLTQVDRDNVGRLEVAWSTTIGPMPALPLSQNQAVPLKVGDHLYICTAFNDVLDLDPETGEVRWEYKANPEVSGLYSTKCRGVTYYEIPEATGQCARRIYTATTDGTLIALDAGSGKPCESFGERGRVSLLRGIEQRNPGYYRVTSPPMLINGKLVVGGAVADGQHVGEPSGVVRAYDAVSGDLAWAWDMGKAGEDSAASTNAEVRYTAGTPNAWGPMSADENLNLVYVPTGNATPDYWGGHRSEEMNRYASSVVALDGDTGEPRWHFQTTHYDVWDYDVASQPVLFDLRTKRGVIPAIVQNTKRGQIFVLDRRTGKPIYPVVEKPAPQDGAVEKLAPTQPWSTALPNLGGPELTETSMWGLTALDQLWCRVKFREARYDGSFTPPGLTSSIADPGYTGGVNWGAASIDTNRQMAFILSNRLVNYIRLVPRTDPAARNLKADSSSNLGGLVAQEGTPYAADIKPFVSPLGVPCQQPPHGLINAIDLTTGKMVWNRPLGTARDTGPMRMPSHLPLTIGTMTFGGTMSTDGGLVFAGGSMDHAFRAFDSETGEMLFEADLPGSAATRPMTYRSKKSGRQFVVVSSDAPYRGGDAYAAITAFVLPED